MNVSVAYNEATWRKIESLKNNELEGMWKEVAMI
jgi:hypothetical protein